MQKEKLLGKELAKKGYRFQGKIAQGGSATIYRIERVNDQKKFALKWIHMNTSCFTSGKEQLLDHFRKSFLLYQHLKHPGIVHLEEFAFFQNTPYAIFEYIEGKNFRQFLMQQKDLSVIQFTDLMKQVLQILVFIHSRQIVHADIKPQNMMVLPKGNTWQIKLIDFESGAFHSCTNHHHENFISPRYAAPNQMKGNRPDFHSDLYSWAVIVLEFFSTHKNQFLKKEIPEQIQKTTLGQLLYRILHDQKENSAVQIQKEFSQIDFSNLKQPAISHLSISTSQEQTIPLP